MNRHLIQNFEISEVTLGTVQLGMPYGITNQRGNLTDADAQEILRLAWNNGINAFDTAPAYGQSEKRIGDFINNDLRGQIETDKPIIITKISGFDQKLNDPKDIYFNLRNSVLKSRNTLHIDPISILLLHRSSDMNNSAIIDSLLDLKREGLIEKIGVSIYTPDEVEKFLDLNLFDVIQIPINIFDHRLLKANFLDELRKKGTIVFARSIFLQGALFLNSDQVPEHLKPIKKYLKQLVEIKTKTNLTIAQIALAFARDLPGITSLVLGVETKEQLEQNLLDFKKGHLSSEIVEEILTEFANVPEYIINPSMWQK